MAILTVPSGLYFVHDESTWFMLSFDVADGMPVASCRYSKHGHATRWSGWVRGAWTFSEGKFSVDMNCAVRDNWVWIERSYCWAGLIRPYTFLSQQFMITDADPVLEPVVPVNVDPVLEPVVRADDLDQP